MYTTECIPEVLLHWRDSVHFLPHLYWCIVWYIHIYKLVLFHQCLEIMYNWPWSHVQWGSLIMSPFYLKIQCNSWTKFCAHHFTVQIQYCPKQYMFFKPHMELINDLCSQLFPLFCGWFYFGSIVKTQIIFIFLFQVFLFSFLFEDTVHCNIHM